MDAAMQGKECIRLADDTVYNKPKVSLLVLHALCRRHVEQLNDPEETTLGGYFSGGHQKGDTPAIVGARMAALTAASAQERAELAGYMFHRRVDKFSYCLRQADADATAENYRSLFCQPQEFVRYITSKERIVEWEEMKAMQAHGLNALAFCTGVHARLGADSRVLLLAGYPKVLRCILQALAEAVVDDCVGIAEVEEELVRMGIIEADEVDY